MKQYVLGHHTISTRNFNRSMFCISVDTVYRQRHQHNDTICMLLLYLLIVNKPYQQSNTGSTLCQSFDLLHHALELIDCTDVYLHWNSVYKCVLKCCAHCLKLNCWKIVTHISLQHYMVVYIYEFHHSLQDCIECEQDRTIPIFVFMYAYPRHTTQLIIHLLHVSAAIQ